MFTIITLFKESCDCTSLKNEEFVSHDLSHMTHQMHDSIETTLGKQTCEKFKLTFKVNSKLGKVGQTIVLQAADSSTNLI